MATNETMREKALKLHKGGKIEIRSKVPLRNGDDLAIAYTPGVAEACKEIKAHPEMVYEYTSKWNQVAIVTDGSRILGLGNIGAEAGLPVMEGKAQLFKTFGGVDAFPICVKSQDIEGIIATVKNIAPVFGGINLEDIEVPKCFDVEDRLKAELDIPVFHDDQHGTAVVALAGLTNALKLVNKQLKDVKMVMNGAGAAGVAITKLLISAGASDIIMCDTHGALYEGRAEGMKPYKEKIAGMTNRSRVGGSLTDVIRGADVFIGASGPGLLTGDMVRSMADDSIVFALANPVPEILPTEAKKAGARVVGTGRSDFPNQINNVLGFPAIFRGALDVRAKEINEKMKMAAAVAIASVIDEPTEDMVVPDAFNPKVAPRVASAVADAAMRSGVARIKKSPEEVARNATYLVNRNRSEVAPK